MLSTRVLAEEAGVIAALPGVLLTLLLLRRCRAGVPKDMVDAIDATVPSTGERPGVPKRTCGVKGGNPDMAVGVQIQVDVLS